MLFRPVFLQTHPLHENIGTQNFVTHTISNTADGAHGVDYGDFDGDGFIDIVSASLADNTIALYSNDGSQNFTKLVLSNTIISPWVVTTTDLDSDGDLDLVGANGENTVYFFENDGMPSSLLVFTYSANGVSHVYAEDIDGDGHQDVLTATTGDDKITFYLNGSTLPRPNSPTNLSPTTPLTIAENQPIGKIVGEFNATDPDFNATLTYHLVSGAGDTDNSLFTLDSNGTQDRDHI